MNELSNEKDKALREILLNYANDDEPRESGTISAILGVLGLDTGMTLRDQFAMAAMQMQVIVAGHLSIDRNKLAQTAYFFADGMMEARK